MKRTLLTLAITLSVGGLVYACSSDDGGGSSSGGTDAGGSSSGKVDSGGSSSSSSSSGSTSSSSSSSSSGGSDGGSDAAKDSGGDGGACLNDTGTVPACPDAACSASCTTITNNFKKGVAIDAFKGLNNAVCTANGAATVVTASAAKACVDATGPAFCDELVTGGCNAGNGFAAFKTQCDALANALSGAGLGDAATLGRKALRDCIHNDPVLDCTTCQDAVKGKN